MCVFWAICSFWNRSDSTAQALCCEFKSMPVERMPPRTACSHMQSLFEHGSISFYIYISSIHGLISSIGIACVPRNPSCSLRLHMLAHVWPLCRFPYLPVLYHNVLLTPRWRACSSLATSGGPIRRFHDKTKKHKSGQHTKSFHTEFRTNCPILNTGKHA